MTSLPFYGLDIETDTSISPTSGLDPRQGGITSVALVGDGLDLVLTRSLGGEASMLHALDAVLSGLPTGVIVTWNGAVFDLPYLDSRSKMVGTHLGLVMRPDPGIHVKYQVTPGHRSGYRARWGRHAHADVQPAYRAEAEAAGIAWSLKPVARHRGFDPVEVDREKMHLLTDAEMSAYVSSDSRVTRLLAALADAEGKLEIDPLR